MLTMINAMVSEWSLLDHDMMIVPLDPLFRAPPSIWEDQAFLLIARPYSTKLTPAHHQFMTLSRISKRQEAFLEYYEQQNVASTRH